MNPSESFPPTSGNGPHGGEQGRVEVLIAGAGPTGLTAALVLAANGVSCRIVERRVGASSTSRALGLQARSMEVLAGLDIARRVEEVAYRLSGASVMRGDHEYVQLPWVPPASPYPYTYVLPQAGLEGILRDRLVELGIRVETGVEVETLDQDEAGVRARLTDGGAIAANWLVGADGSRSSVRTALDIAFPGRATGEAYHLADAVLRLDVPFRDSGMWLGPEGPLMLMRLPGEENLWRVFADVTDAARERDLPGLTPAGLEELLAARGPSGVRVERLDWTSVFRTRVSLADRYRSGRVLLAGDAAHVFPPFGGQGMNLGIQDAVNLGWRLAAIDRGAPETLLDDYEAERRPVAEEVIRDVEGRRRLYALRNPLARALRDIVLRVGGSSHRAARSGSLTNAQLKINYRAVHHDDNTLVETGHSGPRGLPFRRGLLDRRGLVDRGDLRVGDRAPQAPYADRTVHDLFAPDHATLLRFGPNEQGGITRRSGLHSVSVDTSADPDGILAAAYGCSEGGYVLVRPDGYVGARGGHVDHSDQVLPRWMAVTA